VIVAGAREEDMVALPPFKGDGAKHDGVHRRVGGLGNPGADQRVQRLENRISIDHVLMTVRLREARPSTAMQCLLTGQ
jgi:hypothetical protein